MATKPITFILLDSSVLTNGMRVLVEGVDLGQFMLNPVMFYLHNDYSLPIGNWANPRKEGGKILADAELDYDDTDEEVQRIFSKVEKGIIKMASAGLVDLELSDDPVYRIEGQTDYTVIRCRMREASIVPIGRNHNAFRLFDNSGTEINLADKEQRLQLSDYVINVQPKNDKKMSKKLLNLLNLADNAGDELIEKGVELLLADKTALEADKATLEADKATLAEKIAAYEKAEADNLKAQALTLADAAIADGRLDAKSKDSILNLFDKDFEATRVMLESIAKPLNLRDQQLGGNGTDAVRTELAGMTWEEMDKKGKVLLCRDSYPDVYEAAFETKFGKKPMKHS